MPRAFFADVTAPARYVAALILISALILRPLAYGIRISEALSFWCFVVGYVVLPGTLVCRVLGLYSKDRPLLLGMGASVGLALLSFVYAGSKALGSPLLFTLYPLAPLGLALATLRSVRSPNGPAAGPATHTLGLLLVAAAAAELHALYAPALLEQPVSMDALFHVGNAAELRHRWPLEDPRVAGTPLNYHFFGAALPAAASEWTGVPVAELCLVLVPGLTVALLVVQIYNAARVIVHDALTGVLAAALVVFHTDVGAWLGLPPGAFLSYLSSGLYGSPSTLLGLIGLVSLSVPLHGWLGGADRSRGGAIVLLVLSAALSGTKGSVMPVVLLGLSAVVACRALRRRRFPKEALGLAALMALASAPLTLWLYLGPGSYRGLMQFRPGSLLHTTAFYQMACSLLAGGSPVRPHTQPCEGLPLYLEVPVALAWLTGYLGLAGLASLLWLLRQRAPLSDTSLWILAVAASGALLAYGLGTSLGLSQLFFLYNGQVLLAILGGAVLATTIRAPGQGPWVAVTILLLVFGMPMAGRALTGVVEGVERDRLIASLEPTAAARRYREGLAWLRSQPPKDAVVVTRHGAMVVSAYAERRSFYETGFFSPRGHALRWHGIGEPYPGRVAARERLGRSPDAVAVGAVARAAGAAEILLVQDQVEVIGSPGLLELSVGTLDAAPLPDGFASLAYENESLRIYRVRTPR